MAKGQPCKSIVSIWERLVKKALPLTSDSSSITPKPKGCTVCVKVQIYIVFLYVWESLSPGIVIPFHIGTRNFSCFQTLPDMFWGPPSLLPIGMGAPPLRIRRRIVNLTTHLYLVLWLSTSISGDTAPPSRMNSLNGPEKIHLYHSPTLRSAFIFNVHNNTSPNSITYPSSR